MGALDFSTLHMSKNIPEDTDTYHISWLLGTSVLYLLSTHFLTGFSPCMFGADCKVMHKAHIQHASIVELAQQTLRMVQLPLLPLLDAYFYAARAIGACAKQLEDMVHVYI